MVQLPTKQFMTYLEVGKQFSPDAAFLMKKEMHLLFVADEMQTGHPAHYLMNDKTVRLSRSTFTTCPYEVYRVGEGLNARIIPIAADRFSSIAEGTQKRGFKAVVAGELYLVRNYYLPKLDKYKENTYKFERERILVRVEHRERSFSLMNGLKHSERQVEIIEAWTYSAKPEYWGNLVYSDLSPVPVIEPSIHRERHPYYRVLKTEYDEH